MNTVLGPLDYQGGREIHSNAKTSEMILTSTKEFNLCDVWRNFHPNLKHYTRHQRNPKVLSRLDFILVSNSFVDNCVKSKIVPGIQSDHSVVTLTFKDAQSVRGPGFWKLNCNCNYNDADCITTVKEKIDEFKSIHDSSQCNPNVLWDSLKCTITGTCLEYGARKKKKEKLKRID